MNEPTEINASPQTANGVGPDPAVVAALEQRVRRLEDVVAQLQDTHQLEERVVERVATRVATRSEPEILPAAANVLRDSAGLMVSAGRTLLPAAASVLQSQANAADAQARGTVPASRPWLLADAYADLRAIAQMLLDRRFRMSWEGRVVPVVLLIAMVVLPIVFPLVMTSVWILLVVDKVIDLVLGFFIYKVLVREAARYRAVAPLLPPEFRY
jgi:hypothetical protein